MGSNVISDGIYFSKVRFPKSSISLRKPLYFGDQMRIHNISMKTI